MKELKVITLFSGYDSQCLALDRLAADFPEFSYELVAWSEIFPPAIQAHNALFPKWADRNMGDITKVDWAHTPPQWHDIDLLTYSFPCQDISTAGRRAGFAPGSGSRSSLLWECEKAITALHPKSLLMENVKALTDAVNRPMFNRWISLLDSLGYDSFVTVSNACDYGVPQHRERVFMLSFLRGNYFEFRNFPDKMPLTKSIVDYLDPEEPDDSYKIDPRRVTNEVIAAILQQPNVYADLSHLYNLEHEPTAYADPV